MVYGGLGDEMATMYQERRALVANVKETCRQMISGYAPEDRERHAEVSRLMGEFARESGERAAAWKRELSTVQAAKGVQTAKGVSTPRGRKG